MLCYFLYHIYTDIKFYSLMIKIWRKEAAKDEYMLSFSLLYPKT